MKRSLIIPALFTLTIPAILTACSADSAGLQPPVDVPAEVCISFKVKTDAPTRAGVPDDWDAKIKTMVGYITEKGKGDIVAVAQTLLYPESWNETIDNVDIEYQGNGEYEVMMGVSDALTAEKDYDLYVAANITGDDLNKILTARSTSSPNELNSLRITTSSASWTKLGCADVEASKDMPMSCAKPISFRLEKDTEYSRENPVLVGNSGTDRQKFDLVRAISRLDFKDESESGNHQYDIQNSDGSLIAEFKQITPINLEPSAFMRLTYKTTEAEGLVTIPTGGTQFHASAVDLPTTASDFQKVFYMPENVHDHSTLTISNSTGFQLTAVLRPGAKCDADLAAYLNGTKLTADGKHPTLYYYDDGVFQSPLRYRDANPGADWFAVKWDDKLGGYAVTYRHTIRHGGTKGDQSTDTDPTDGDISPMEYAVVRNHIYQTSVTSVTSLPRRDDPNDTPESGKQDISIRINPPAKWTYHRGGFEISFE
ncbi:MAG: fimbria major subunit [Bacteroides sp.]|nr:fimbria major subunit [Bacteroides sp.]